MLIRLLAVLSLIFINSAQAQNERISPSFITKPASKSQVDALFQYRDRLNFALAPIKSIEDFNFYQNETSEKDNPLNFLPPEEKNEFIKSLSFNEKGLTSYNYAILQK